MDKLPRKPFCWGQEQQRSFDALKTAMINAPVLSYANFDMPFEVHVDASSTGLGAVLCQRHDEGLHVVAYASRGLRPSEVNYSAYKREFLALKWAITDKFHDYLYGSHFDVWTDSNPLTYVLSSAQLDATGHRWLSKLASFDFSVLYKPGKTNTDADGLSRIPAISNEEIEAICNFKTPEDGCVSCFPMTVDAAKQFEESGEPLVDTLNMNKLQSEDVNLSQIIDWKLHGVPPNVKFSTFSSVVARLARNLDKLVMINGVLFRRKQNDSQEINQLLVPSSCVEKVLHGLHDDIGHPGRDRTLSLIQSRFYWPGYTKDVENHVRQCFRGVCHKSRNLKAPVVPIITSQPMELVCLDYLLVEPSQGYEHLLVITDHFTKFARVIPTQNESAKTTAKALVDNFITQYGYPLRIHSDQGRNFESSLIKEMCNITSILKSRTTPYHPAGNGSCEKFNSTLLGLLGTLAVDKKSMWKEYLNLLVLAYNCTPHQTTGFAPYQLMFGRVPRLPIDSMFGLTNLEEISVLFLFCCQFERKNQLRSRTSSKEYETKG